MPGPDPDRDEVADPPVTALVVVSHNTRDDAVACLDGAGEAGADEVVLVDSGSTDDTVAAVAAAHPGVHVVELANLGFGQAANAGVAVTTAPAVVIANADTRFGAGSIRAMGEVLERGGPDGELIGAVGPLVRHPDGRLQPSARAFPSIGQALGHAVFGLWWPTNPWTRAYRLTDWDHASPRTVDWVSGCALAVDRRAFDAVGGFDPAYFMFVEDVDLCWRLRQAGWGVRFSPEAEVVHAIGASVSRRRVRMVVEHAKSLDRFFARRYTSRVARLARPLLRLGLVGWALSALAWSAVRGHRTTHAQAS